MSLKEQYTLAATHLLKGVAMTGKALWQTLRMAFTVCPNATWTLIAAAIVVAATVQIGKARAERDHYAKRAAQLQHQLDSCTGRRTAYVRYQ